MGEMDMPVPDNSIPMVGGRGQYDYITMGGMFTILKVRENLSSYDDPGWYAAPAGSQADLASAEELRQDGIDLTVKPTDSAGAPAASMPMNMHAHDHSDHSAQASQPATRPSPRQMYTCKMHPEVASDSPGACPKCGMKLIPATAPR